MKLVKLGSLAATVAILAALWFWFDRQSQTDALPISAQAADTQKTRSSADAQASGLATPANTGDFSKPATEGAAKQDSTAKPAASADAKPAARGDAQSGVGGSKPAAGADAKPGASGGAKPAAGGRGGRGGARPPALVVTQTVTQALINDRLRAVGSGAAIASVSVVPRSDGILTEVLVKSGQRVNQGDVLARLDDESQIIARDRAARTLEDAVRDEARLVKLFRSNISTEVELNSTRAALADAELSLREAQLTLSRRTVTAPVTGVVGLIAVDTGNYVTQQTELATIDDRSTIIVEFWVPERFANQIMVDQVVQATALANPSIVYEGTISGIGSRIETDSRTLPLEAQLDNASDSLRPGMSFDLELSFAGQEFAAVNPLSIQWDSKGSFVWQIIEGKATRQDVKIIQRNPESVLIEGDIAVDDEVVVEGLLALRPGAAVRVQGANR